MAWPARLGVVLLALTLGWWFAPSQGFSRWESLWLDSLQRLRIALTPPPESPPLLVVGVDEETLRYLDKPSLFWPSDFSRLAQGLLDAGATAVAFDLVFACPSHGLSPALEAELEEHRMGLLQLVAQGQVALGYLPDDENGAVGIHNHPDLEAAAGGLGNLCSLGLIVDPDGLYRRTLAYPGGQPGLACWLAQKLGHSLQLQGQDLVVDGRPFPLENGTLRCAYRRPALSTVSARVLLERLAGKQPLEQARGKVCVIAPTAVSLGDFRPSVYDGLKSKRDQGGTYGIEHHLAAVETLLCGQPIRPYPTWMALVVCSLAGSLAWVLGARARRGPAFMLTIAAHLGVTATAFVLEGVWLPLWSPLLSLLVGYAAGYQWRYWKVERARRLTVDMFSRMVAPQVVQQVLSDPSLRQLGGVQRRVTVLYTDINDFTPMCERHTPSEVIVMLNQYFEEMVSLVFQRQGMLKQFVGDEIMCIYGAPFEQPDHAARAVNTALDMLERLHEMELAAAGADGFFDIKVGINTGDVVVGHVGSDKHMEYAAVGDDVNLGARIMSTTKKLNVKILVSESTKKEAEAWLPEVEWISHGVQSFKGKTAQLEVFEVRRKPKS